MKKSIEHGGYWKLGDAERATIAADVEPLLQRMFAEDVVRLT